MRSSMRPVLLIKRAGTPTETRLIVEGKLTPGQAAFLPGSPVEVGDIVVSGSQRYRVTAVSLRGDGGGDPSGGLVDATLE
jgi:hypothetical protein